MKKQLLTLQELISVLDPELYRHLGAARLFVFANDLHRLPVLSTTEKTDGLNLFFCFRCDPVSCRALLWLMLF